MTGGDEVHMTMNDFNAELLEPDDPLRDPEYVKMLAKRESEDLEDAAKRERISQGRRRAGLTGGVIDRYSLRPSTPDREV